MPTPFTHLVVAQRLLSDPRIPKEIRDVMRREEPAFLLGSVAADGRVDLGSERQETHFYRYDRPQTERAWRSMLRQHPTLSKTKQVHHLVFLAAYVAHLAVDEGWTKRMLRPHFAEKDWCGGESRDERFRRLHYLLSWMDERDWQRLDETCAARLLAAQPAHWLPFFSDESLRNWRDRIAQQLPPKGVSETLAVFGRRIGQAPELIRARLDDEGWMQEHLWQNIPQRLLGDIEQSLLADASEQLQVYWQECECSW